MSKWLASNLILLLLLVACTSVNTLAPTALPTATNTPAPTATNTLTFTPTPTPTPTETPTETPTPTDTPTPRPTNTPTPPELMPSDVGLPFNPTEVGHFRYIPCYIFTETHFHAGDAIVFEEVEIQGTRYVIITPIDGIIVESSFVNETVGYEVSIRTRFILDGERVHYDLVHHSGLVEGLHVGSAVERGDPLVIIEHPYGNPFGHTTKFLDIGIRKGTHKQANPNSDNWIGTEYFSFLDYVRDDLEELPSDSFYLDSPCTGNPIPVEKR